MYDAALAVRTVIYAESARGNSPLTERRPKRGFKVAVHREDVRCVDADGNNRPSRLLPPGERRVSRYSSLVLQATAADRGRHRAVSVPVIGRDVGSGGRHIIIMTYLLTLVGPRRELSGGRRMS